MITVAEDRKSRARLCNGGVDILEFQFIFSDETSKQENQIYHLIIKS